MSEELGPVRYALPAGTAYLGGEAGIRPDVSEETSRLIDDSVRIMVGAAEERAGRLLTDHRGALTAIAAELEAREVIGGEDVRRLAGELGGGISASPDEADPPDDSGPSSDPSPAPPSDEAEPVDDGTPVSTRGGTTP